MWTIVWLRRTAVLYFESSYQKLCAASVHLDCGVLDQSSRAARLLGRDRGKVSQDGKSHRPGVKGHRSPIKAEPVARPETNTTMQTAPGGKNHPARLTVSPTIQTEVSKKRFRCFVHSPFRLQ